MCVVALVTRGPFIGPVDKGRLLTLRPSRFMWSPYCGLPLWSYFVGWTIARSYYSHMWSRCGASLALAAQYCASLRWKVRLSMLGGPVTHTRHITAPACLRAILPLMIPCCPLSDAAILTQSSSRIDYPSLQNPNPRLTQDFGRDAGQVLYSAVKEDSDGGMIGACTLQSKRTAMEA